MSEFAFGTDARSEQYCREIVAVLRNSYGLSEREGLRLVNAFWKGQPFVGERDLRYHRGGPEDWAKHMVAHTPH